jgi:hypothetical protein
MDSDCERFVYRARLKCFISLVTTVCHRVATSCICMYVVYLIISLLFFVFLSFRVLFPFIPPFCFFHFLFFHFSFFRFPFFIPPFFSFTFSSFRYAFFSFFYYLIWHFVICSFLSFSLFYLTFLSNFFSSFFTGLRTCVVIPEENGTSYRYIFFLLLFIPY